MQNHMIHTIESVVLSINQDAFFGVDENAKENQKCKFICSEKLNGSMVNFIIAAWNSKR